MGEAKWYVQFSGHPTPELTWYDNQNKIIQWSNNDKYYVKTDSSHTTIKIRNLTFEDSGDYTLIASNGLQNVEQKFTLKVKGM